MAPLPLGWSRTRYDRAILTPIHLRDPATRKVRIVDMESYKSALVKFGKKTEVTEKSVADLTWPTWDGVEDDEDEVEGEKSGPAPRLPAPATVSSPSETKEDVHMPESTVPDVKPVVAPAKAPKAAENTKPQEAPAKPAEKAKKPAEPPKKLAEPPKPKPAQATQPEDRIAKALREEKRKSLSLLMAVLAGEDEDETKEAKDENMGGVVSFLDDDFETAPKHAPVRARPFALESSSDEDSGDDGEQSDHNSEPKVEDSKPVEAENAEMAEADEPESESTGSSFEGAEESAESESERQKNDALVQSVSDSDDESASGVEESSAKGSEPVEETQQGESSSQETNQPDQRVQPQQPDQPEQQAEYKVNTDLRALIFAPSSSSAATKPGVAGLFGGGIRTKFKLTTALGLEDSEDEGEEDDAQKAEPEMARETRETPIPRDSIPIASSRGAKPLFAHFGHPTLDFRLFYPLPPDAVPFHRHESEEEVVKRWEETRKELTEGYKKRHKQAVRRRRKMGLGVELD